MHVVNRVSLLVVIFKKGVDPVYFISSLVILFRSVKHYKRDCLLVMLWKPLIEEKAKFLTRNLLISNASFSSCVEISVILSKARWIINTLVNKGLQV